MASFWNELLLYGIRSTTKTDLDASCHMPSRRLCRPPAGQSEGLETSGKGRGKMLSDVMGIERYWNNVSYLYGYTTVAT